jgi:ubiquinol-cytochrome c reductase iron-sulfur subunit
MEENKKNRRDFIVLAASSVGVAGVAAATWPLINSLNPAANVLALSSVEIDISSIPEGQTIKVMWRGKPVFIRHRTKTEIETARDDDTDGDLIDPQNDADRVKEGKEQWLITVGVCTHLGCIPLVDKGDYNGWFCPCHGSHYDVSGRIRKGPAPKNLLVPEYAFISDAVVRIG